MNTLQVGADSSWQIHAFAAAILFLHIAGGTVGLVAGPVALVVQKGSRAHALAGTTFLISMITMAFIGALVAPFLTDADGTPKLFDSVMACFTCYLVVTGWLTVKRKKGTIGRLEIFTCVFAFLLSGVMILVAIEAPGDPTGNYILAGFIALAGASDFQLIRSGGTTGGARIARHLGRMGAALVIANISFFLGQQRVMPQFMHGSPLLFLPPLVVLGTTSLWLVKIRFGKKRGGVWSFLSRPSALKTLGKSVPSPAYLDTGN